MCGIAGLINLDDAPVDEPLLRRMTDALAHRGPDASGLTVSGSVGLGHRRLTIIDVSDAANQPMFNEDGTVAVVFNGEIYNFQELVPMLETRGHRFQTHSDTEVIVHAWEEFGPKCVDYFRGMFALCIHDRRQRQLFLTRDRLGKKPLYYFKDDTRLAFASELKSLCLVPDLSRDLDLQAVGQYAAYGNTLSERTIYASIRRLPAGSWMLVSLDEATTEPIRQRYWSPEPECDDSLTESECLEELDRVLEESVRLRMISDVPLGAFLSGGIDSSLVVAYMTRIASEPVKTFTMGFEERTHDESDHARRIADHLGTEHEEMIVRPDAAHILDELIDVYDEPFADESAIPTYYLCQMTRRGVKVALSGDGGDETHLGYNRYPISRIMNGLAVSITPVGRGVARGIASRLPASARLRRPLDRVGHVDFDLYDHAMGHSDDHMVLLNPEVRRQLDRDVSRSMTDAFHGPASATRLQRYAFTDLKNYLPDDILVKVDRASMAHSLEVRCPLLDHRLVELSCRIPDRLKLRRMTGKRLLRTLLIRHVPRELIDRPKMGFGVPLSSWFRNELADVLDQMVRHSSSPAWQYLDHGAVSARVRAHQSGKADLHTGLWRALFFYRWCETHLSSPTDLRTG